MRILVNLENTDDFKEFLIEDHEPLENLKYLVEAEMNIPFSHQEIKFEGNVLTNDKLPLREYKIKEEEIILVNRRGIADNFSQLLNQIRPNNTLNNTNNFSHQNNLNNSKPASSTQNSLSNIFDSTMKMIKQNANPNLGGSFNFLSLDAKVKNECKNLKERFLTSPDELSLLFTTDPELAETLVSQDEKRLEELIKIRISKYEDKMKKEKDEYFKLMNADPSDLEAQKKIEEMIRMKNVDENLKMAQEYLPETFMSVHMLFINLEINKQKIIGLVDTGAQMTIISEDLAKKCGVYNLIDTRYSGIAKGVGTSKILGVVHAAQLKLGEK